MDRSLSVDKEIEKFTRKQVIVKGYTLPEGYLHIQDDIENFEVYDDDIWICSFPKSGTTWIQELVWMIAHDLDYNSAKVDNEIRMPFIEYSSYFSPDIKKTIKIEEEYISNSMEFARKAKRPRIIKTHLPFELLPKQIQRFERTPKIINIYRNLKDLCISSYHHYKLFSLFNGEFEDFWKLLLREQVGYSPVVNHVKSYWQYKDKDNILLIRYEDMQSDLRSVVLDVCTFLNKSISEEDMNVLLDHLSFDSMKQNPYVDKHTVIEFSNRIKGKAVEGKFFRQGKSGIYKSIMSDNVKRAFDEYLEKKLIGTDLKL